ncbi:MAG: hypothetical protein AAF497_06035 [Planctomycetota bacterium]
MNDIPPTDDANEFDGPIPPPRKKPGPKSSVLDHPEFARIELALANNLSVPALAKKFDLSPDALYRFRKTMSAERLATLRFVPEEVRSPIDLEALKRSEGEALFQRISIMLRDIYGGWRAALATGDHRSAASMANVHHKYVETQARLLGELPDGGRHIHINVINSPEFRGFVSRVMAWASGHPDLAAELARFLEEVAPDLANRRTIEHADS